MYYTHVCIYIYIHMLSKCTTAKKHLAGKR